MFYNKSGNTRNSDNVQSFNTIKVVIDEKEFQYLFKGALSGLRQSLTTESLLKMMKSAFYFTSKALFVLKIFKFLS